MEANLRYEVERRALDSALTDEEKLLAMSACEDLGSIEGMLEIEDLASKISTRKTTHSTVPPVTKVPSAWLESIEVEGFRGVGPSLSLSLNPGPGLTLVVGRNGSGKSSLSEGLEVLFTGTAARFEDKSTEWKSSWRNLHYDRRTRVSATLSVDGFGKVSATRSWSDEANYEQGRLRLRATKAEELTTEMLGWDQLERHRPFLSYAELSKLALQPSRSYDALSGVLGLASLSTTRKHFGQLRRSMKEREKSVVAQDAEMLSKLENSEDPRAIRAIDAIIGTGTQKRPEPDFAVLESIAIGARNPDIDAKTARLSQLARLHLGIDFLALSEAWSHAEEALAAHATEAAEAQSETARLLEMALNLLKGESPCPVCEQTLPEDARQSIQKRAVMLRDKVRAFSDAQSKTQKVMRQIEEAKAKCQALRPHFADEAFQQEIAQMVKSQNPVDFGVHGAQLESLLSERRETAESTLRELDLQFRPLQKALLSWLDARQDPAALRQKRLQLKHVEDWFKTVESDLRQQRVAPFRNEVLELWKRLGRGSDVALVDVDFAGSGTKRKLKLDSVVGGREAPAQGVMSQGELCAMALALFLPRTASKESPFRFVIIDDPVQAMDPVRVDALAEILASTAEHSQVIVFTHDERLPSALQRMQLPATVYRVDRRSESTIGIEQVADPVQNYLDDARALALTRELDERIKARVVPAFCRLAIEQAATTRYRRKQYQKGVSHHQVDNAIRDASRIYEVLSLALFLEKRDDEEVRQRLNADFGTSAVACIRSCNDGTHEGDHDYPSLVRSAELITKHLSGQKGAKAKSRKVSNRK